MAGLVDAPWMIANSNDLRFPQAAGGGVPDAEFETYLSRLRARLPDDPVPGTAFLRVTNLVDPPSRLLAPDIMARVAGSVPA